MEVQQQSIIIAITEDKSIESIAIDGIFENPYVTLALIAAALMYIIYSSFIKKNEREMKVPEICTFSKKNVENLFNNIKSSAEVTNPIESLERWQEISRKQEVKNAKKVNKIDNFTKNHQQNKKIGKQTQLFRLKMNEEKIKQKEKERLLKKYQEEENKPENRKRIFQQLRNRRIEEHEAKMMASDDIYGRKAMKGANEEAITICRNSKPKKFNENVQNEAKKEAVDKSKQEQKPAEAHHKIQKVNNSSSQSLFSSMNVIKNEQSKMPFTMFAPNPLNFASVGTFGENVTKNASFFTPSSALSTSKPAIEPTQVPKKTTNILIIPPAVVNNQTVPPGNKPVQSTITPPVVVVPTSSPAVPSPIVTNPPAPTPASTSTSTSTPAPAPAPSANQKLKLTSQQYLETIIKFAQSMTISAQITTTMSNLGGARSNINDLLVFSKSFINSINKEDDKQITTFALKVYNSIVHTLIAESNVKEGLERMPPKSKTSQVEKSSITCYIIIVNFYRMMGYEKVWTIIFGKTLKLLQFIYTRKEDLKSYKDLDLIKNKYIELKGDIAGRYLSRMDFLTYFLFGLTAFDPHLIFSQIEHKDASVRKSREEIESWNYKWSYKEFWMLTDVFFRNKHESYFKPIIYSNLLSVLFSRVYEHKRNPTLFKEENDLYKITLDLGKQFFSKYNSNKEIAVLSNDDEGTHERYHFSYDGEDFTNAGIKVLDLRLGTEKLAEFRLGPKDFDTKANVFYYFCKEKQ